MRLLINLSLVKGTVEAETHLNIMQNVCGCEILPQQCLQPVSDDATTASVEAGSCSLPVDFLLDKYSTRLPHWSLGSTMRIWKWGWHQVFQTETTIWSILRYELQIKILSFALCSLLRSLCRGELCLHNTIHQSLCCTSTSAHAFTFSQLVKGDVVCQHLEHFIKTYFTL